MADVTKLVSKADEAAAKRNYDYAIELYLQALTLDPDNGGARAALRTTQLKQLNESGGGGALGGILTIGSRLMAAVNGFTKNFERQAICLEAIMRRSPTSTGTALKLARALYRSGAKKSARAVFEAIPEWDGANIDALKGAAAIAREMQDFDDALHLYQRAKAIAPNDKTVNDSIRDISATRSIEVREGAESYRDVLKDEGQAADLERRQRKVQGTGSAQDEAVELEAQLKAAPGDLPTLRRLARVYEQAKKFDQAVETYRRILRIEPNDFDAATRISEIELTKYDRRIAKLKQMLKADPGDEKSQADLKQTKAARQQFEQDDLAKRVAAHPTETALRLKYGRALFAGGKLSEAVSEFQQTKGEPQFARESAYWLGRCFLKGGKGSLAVKQLEKVVAEAGSAGRLDDMGKEAHYFLGKALEQMDDSDGARQHFERIYEEDINFRDVAALVEG